jgi:hypothetical protein
MKMNKMNGKTIGIKIDAIESVHPVTIEEQRCITDMNGNKNTFTLGELTPGIEIQAVDSNCFLETFKTEVDRDARLDELLKEIEEYKEDACTQQNS